MVAPKQEQIIFSTFEKVQLVVCIVATLITIIVCVCLGTQRRWLALACSIVSCLSFCFFVFNGLSKRSIFAVIAFTSMLLAVGDLFLKHRNFDMDRKEAIASFLGSIELTQCKSASNKYQRAKMVCGMATPLDALSAGQEAAKIVYLPEEASLIAGIFSCSEPAPDPCVAAVKDLSRACPAALDSMPTKTRNYFKQ